MFLLFLEAKIQKNMQIKNPQKIMGNANLKISTKQRHLRKSFLLLHIKNKIWIFLDFEKNLDAKQLNFSY